MVTAPFFPTPYPDELYYSIIARYRAWSNSTRKRLQSDLLVTNRAGMGLPSRLQDFYNLLPRGSTLVPEILIEKHSFLPVFYPFIEPIDVQELKYAMITHSMLRVQALLKGEQRYISEFLKFCPSCLLEDETRFGEAYWHTHQFRGVYYCPEHQVSLVYSNIRSVGRTHLDIIPLTPNIGTIPTQPILAEENKFFWLRVAQSYNWLLCNPTIITQKSLISKYKYYLHKMSLTCGQLINRRELQKLFNAFLHEKNLGECEEILSNEKAWLADNPKFKGLSAFSCCLRNCIFIPMYLH